MRIECDLAGFESNWIEVEERWTQRDVMALDEAGVQELMPILQRKTTACHIVLEDGGALTEPSELTEDSLLDVDIAVLAWLAQALVIAIGRRRSLGNWSARLLSAQNGQLDAVKQ